MVTPHSPDLVRSRKQEFSIIRPNRVPVPKREGGTMSEISENLEIETKVET